MKLLLELHHKIHKHEKNTPSYGSCKMMYSSFAVIYILQLLSQWICVCVCTHPFISSWGSLASGYSVFTKFLGKTKASFWHWEMLNFWGENTLPSTWREWNEMNEWFEGPHRIWASWTLNNNNNKRLVPFQFFALK
jgi:hypothetical protein